MVWCNRCVVMVLSKKRDFCKRNGKRYGDVFIGSKMMKFQNKRVREGWIVVCYCYLRRMEKYGNV